MKQIFAAGLLTFTSLFPVPSGWSDEPKYHDKDLIYDEPRVPAYDLPPLLVSSEGKPITTAEDWFNIRRPQIVALFGTSFTAPCPFPNRPYAQRLRW